MIHSISRRGLLLAAICLAAVPAAPAADNGGARIGYHYIGRVILSFTSPTGTIYGYVTHLDGVGAGTDLFKGGVVGEKTALLTFRADITMDTLPANGGVSSFLVRPGTFQVYFTDNPNHNWDSPDSFSNGQTVAVFSRETEQFSTMTLTPGNVLALNAASAALRSATPFVLNGRHVTIQTVFPNGVTNVTSGPATPVAATQTSITFPFAGYGLKIGD